MPLHQYFWSITVKVRWCSFAPEHVVCGHRRNIWCCKPPEKDQVKGKDEQKKKSQAHLNTCRRPNIRDVLSLIIYRQQRVLDGRRRTDTHNEHCNLFPAVKMKSGNTKTIRSYDYDLLLLGCKIQACLLTRHKNVFPKVSIQ